MLLQVLTYMIWIILLNLLQICKVINYKCFKSKILICTQRYSQVVIHLYIDFFYQVQFIELNIDRNVGMSNTILIVLLIYFHD